MPHSIVWIFLFVAALFAAVHDFAVATALYWYYPWFDVIMHLWGGALVVMGVYTICSLKLVTLTPTPGFILASLLVFMITWEVFEYAVGLYNPSTYWFDTAKDFLMGTIGGLVGFSLLRRLKI